MKTAFLKHLSFPIEVYAVNAEFMPMPVLTWGTKECRVQGLTPNFE
jgi:hypothetical protein